MRGRPRPPSNGRMVHLIIALFRATGNAISVVVAVCRPRIQRDLGPGPRGSQRRLTVLSPPGLLCGRSSSNGESVPDGREAVRTRAEPSRRRRPSCSAAPRGTHPAALQQTDGQPLHYKDTASSFVSGDAFSYARARARGRKEEQKKKTETRARFHRFS